MNEDCERELSETLKTHFPQDMTKSSPYTLLHITYILTEHKVKNFIKKCVQKVCYVFTVNRATVYRLEDEEIHH